VSSDLTKDFENMERGQLLERLHEEVQAQSALTAFYHQGVADRLGLNPTDYKCLTVILKSAVSGYVGPMTPGELAKVTRLTTGAVTGVLDRLEQAGFVRREHDPEDRRRIIVRPFPERIHRDLEPVWESLARAFDECCSDYTLEELALLIGFTLRTQQLLKEACTALVPSASVSSSGHKTPL
jgi:DNA-binding MarR family transcriptional regulator